MKSSSAVLEHALLHIIPGESKAFEQAFARARPFIESSPGFLSLDLLQGLENHNTYLLLVRWRSLEDHEVGFRGSPAYAEWRRLLHHFYEPFPEVRHFAAMVAGYVAL